MSLIDRIIGLFQEDWIEDFKEATGGDAPEESSKTVVQKPENTLQKQSAHQKAFIHKSKSPQNIFSKADESNTLNEEKTPPVKSDDSLFEHLLDDYFSREKTAETKDKNALPKEETPDISPEDVHLHTPPQNEATIETEDATTEADPAIDSEKMPETTPLADVIQTKLPIDTYQENTPADMDQAFDEINAMLDQQTDVDDIEPAVQTENIDFNPHLPESNLTNKTLPHPQAEISDAGNLEKDKATEPLINSERSSTLQKEERHLDDQNNLRQNGEAELLNRLKQGAKSWNEWRKENPGLRLNLQGANLRGLDLSMMILDNIDFQNADFQETCLWNTRFVRANLSNVDFSNAELCETSFQQADLRGASLNSAKVGLFLFDGINMQQANLRGAALDGINLESFNLTDAFIDSDEIPA